MLSSSETLEQEHKKAKLRKNFLTNDFRETIKNHLISDKKLEIIIERLKEHPDIIEDLFFEPAGGELALKLSDKIFETVLKNTNNYEKLVFSKDGNGKTFIQKAPDSKIIIFNEAAQDMPALLENVYTIADSRGRLPAHYLPPKVLKSMNAVLKNNPRILHTIYTTQDKHGNTPAHNRFYASYKEISKVLKEMPATASKIERLQNKFGENYTHAILQAKQYKGPYKETWNYILNNC